jgi:transmembrane sensor
MTKPPINNRMAVLAFKKVSGSLTDEELVELNSIIESSPDKRELFEELMDPDRNAEDLISMSESNLEASWEKVKARVPFAPKKRRWPRFLLAAASVILVIGFIVVYLLRNEFDKPATVQSTIRATTNSAAIKDSVAIIVGADGTEVLVGNDQSGIVAYIENKPVQMKGSILIIPEITSAGPILRSLPGKELQVWLSDGTRVWLTGNSELNLHEGFTAAKRTLALNGEGYFEVTKKDGVRFAVRALGVDATVLGTRFNISAYDNGPVTTSLFEGKVNLSAGEKNIVLSENEEAVWANNEFSRRNLPKTSADKVDGKKSGFFIFEDKIKTILDEVARNYNCSIEYIGEIPDSEYSGSFHRNMPIDSLLKNLSTSMLIDLTLHGNKIVADFRKSK